MIWKKEQNDSSAPSSAATKTTTNNSDNNDNNVNENNENKENNVNDSAEILDGDAHLHRVRASLAALLNDKRLDAATRAKMQEEYAQLQRLFDKLEHEHIHVAVFGRVSVGKSALLNALAGQEIFATDVLHGKTKNSAQTLWQEYDNGGVYLLDTPGIDEIDGAERAKIAENVAHHADIIIFVVDSDIDDIEYRALQNLYQVGQPIILALNKIDRLSGEQCEKLLAHLRHRVSAFLEQNHVVAVCAAPLATLEIHIDENGKEHEKWFEPPSDVDELRMLLWRLLDEGGKSYAALNAGLFAGQLSEKVGAEIIATRREFAEKIIKQYALIKAIGVAVNPIPVVDLLALAADAAMVVHLSKIYGIDFTKNQAQTLIQTIAVHLGVLMGTVYGIHAVSSLLKGLTAGLSTIVTAGAQGGVAFYGSYAIGKAAEQYFAQGASWGELGAKQVIEDILRDLNKEQLIEEARFSLKKYSSFFKSEYFKAQYLKDSYLKNIENIKNAKAIKNIKKIKDIETVKNIKNSKYFKHFNNRVNNRGDKDDGN